MRDARQQVKRIAVTTGMLWCVGHTGGAYALGFGDLQLQSALNQPLDATIALTSLSASERDSLAIRIASPDLFQRFGIERAPLMDDLQIETTDGGSGRMVLHLSSRQPVREPFLNVLVEAETRDGRALREYTLLLDPPGHPVSSGIAATRSTTQPREAFARHAYTSQAASRRPPPPVDATVHQGTYGPVRAGETLWALAARLRPAGASVHQMQVALFDANPQAFTGNMNTLLRGSMLTVPETARVVAIDPATADTRVAARASRPVSAATRHTATNQASTPLGEAPSPDMRPAAGDTPDTQVTQGGDSPDDGSIEAAEGGRFGRLTAPDAADWAPRRKIGTLTDGGDALAAGPETDVGSVAAADAGGSGKADAPASAGNELETLAGSDDPRARQSESASTPSSAGGQAAATAAGADNAVIEDEPVTHPLENVAQTGTVDDGATTVGAVEVAPSHAVPATTQDIADVDDSGWLSPRNILLYAGLGVLGLLLLARRRKNQYKRVPLDALGAATKHSEGSEAGEPTQAIAVTSAAADTGEPASPSQRIREAEQQIEAGEFTQARDTLERGLAEHAGQPELQDKILELDYLMGDVSRFEQDLARYNKDIGRSGERQAAIAAMGRVLLPGDSRFVFAHQGVAQSHALPSNSHYARTEEAIPAHPNSASLEQRQAASGSGHAVHVTRSDTAGRRWSDRPIRGASEDAANELMASEAPADSGATVKQTPTGNSTDDAQHPPAPDEVDDGSLRLDTSESDLSAYDWQASEIDTSGERQHDKGDEPGLTFDLDGLDRSDTQTSAPIDASEFDLDDEHEPGEHDEDDDPVAVRLDLARVYLEMEDDAAARSLLEEILDTGDESQREDARALLAKLG